GAIGISNAHRYFHVYAPSRDCELHTEVARFAAKVSGTREVVLDCVPIIYFRYGTTLFLAPNARGRDLQGIASEPEAGASDDRAFLFCPDRTEHLRQIQTRFPGGSLAEHRCRGRTVFLSYLLPSEERGS